MRCVFIVIIIWIQGCATTATPPNDDRVIVGTQKPGPAYILISGIEASDGEGCGITKKWGTRESAIHLIQSKAAQLGAAYVFISAEIPPHREGSCRVNTYQIKGQAYRKVDGK